MRNFLAFLTVAILTFAGVGYYLGWFTIQTSRPSSGNPSVNIEFDPEKIGGDLQKGKEQLLHKTDGSAPDAPDSGPRDESGKRVESKGEGARPARNH